MLTSAPAPETRILSSDWLEHFVAVLGEWLTASSKILRVEGASDQGLWRKISLKYKKKITDTTFAFHLLTFIYVFHYVFQILGS